MTKQAEGVSCSRCGHASQVDVNGLCRAAIFPIYDDPRRPAYDLCGCHCVFPTEQDQESGDEAHPSMPHGRSGERQPTGYDLIADERERQQTKEGYTHDHDDQHQLGELGQAAHCYWLLGAGSLGNDDQSEVEAPEGWPWEPEDWNPKTRLRNLVRAGALFQAEIDRLCRTRMQVTESIDALLASKPDTSTAKPAISDDTTEGVCPHLHQDFTGSVDKCLDCGESLPFPTRAAPQADQKSVWDLAIEIASLERLTDDVGNRTTTTGLMMLLGSLKQPDEATPEVDEASRRPWHVRDLNVKLGEVFVIDCGDPKIPHTYGCVATVLNAANVMSFSAHQVEEHEKAKATAQLIVAAVNAVDAERDLLQEQLAEAKAEIKECSCVCHAEKRALAAEKAERRKCPKC